MRAALLLVVALAVGAVAKSQDVADGNIARRLAELEEKLDKTHKALQLAKKLSRHSEKSAGHIHIAGKPLGHAEPVAPIVKHTVHPPPLHVYTPEHRLADAEPAPVARHTQPSILGPKHSGGSSRLVFAKDKSHDDDLAVDMQGGHRPHDGGKNDEEKLLHAAWPSPSSTMAADDRTTRARREVLQADLEADLEARGTPYMSDLQANRAVKQVEQLQQLQALRSAQSPPAESHLDFQPRAYGVAPVMQASTQLTQAPALGSYMSAMQPYALPMAGAFPQGQAQPVPASPGSFGAPMAYGAQPPFGAAYGGPMQFGAGAGVGAGARAGAGAGMQDLMQLSPGMARGGGAAMGPMGGMGQAGAMFGAAGATRPSSGSGGAEQQLVQKLAARAAGTGGISPREMRQLRFMHGDFSPPIKP
jgi:hypothetical protein